MDKGWTQGMSKNILERKLLTSVSQNPAPSIDLFLRETQGSSNSMTRRKRDRKHRRYFKPYGRRQLGRSWLVSTRMGKVSFPIFIIQFENIFALSQNYETL